MSLIGLILTLVVVGVLLWLLNNYVPMPTLVSGGRCLTAHRQGGERVGPKANRQAECRSLHSWRSRWQFATPGLRGLGRSRGAPTVGVYTEKVKEGLRWS